MRCLKCGKENDNSARFCVNCGSKLNNPQTPPQGNNPQWNPQTPPQGNNPQWNPQTPPQGNNPQWNPQTPPQRNNPQWNPQTPPQGNNPQWNPQTPPQGNNPQWNPQTPPQGNNPQWNPQTPPQGNNPQWNTGAKSSKLPMNWHNFIVNVAYILAMLSLIGNAAKLITNVLGEDNGLSGLPGVICINVFYALCNVGFAIVIFLIRNELHKFKKNSWKYFIAYIIANNVLSIVYLVVYYLVINLYWGGFGFPINSDIIVIILATVVATVCNYIYYKKREHLFVN